MKHYGIIYKILNKINNKIYIGQTTRAKGFNGRYYGKGVGIERVYNYYKHRQSLIDSKKEFRKNGYNVHLMSSIEKYGFDAFIVDEIFDIAYSKEELDNKEKYWISYYKSNDPLHGYNSESGGYNFTMSEETKQKISSKNKGRVYTDATKKKMSESHIGNKNSEETRTKLSKALRGKTKSSETAKRISESKKGKPVSNTAKENSIKSRSIPVCQYDLNGNLIKEWPSINIAAKELQANQGNIWCCCNGRQKTSSGYIWKYKEGNE